MREKVSPPKRGPSAGSSRPNKSGTPVSCDSAPPRTALAMPWTAIRSQSGGSKPDRRRAERVMRPGRDKTRYFMKYRRIAFSGPWASS